jgi:archaellum biogenesis ATPase FlaH
MLLEKKIKSVVKRRSNGGSILLELFSQTYFQANCSVLKHLADSNYYGIFISSQRPFQNLVTLLKNNSIPLKNLYFVDVAVALAKEEQKKYPNCIHVPHDIDIDALTSAIYTAFLSKLRTEKKFIFIDSLTTMLAYSPIYEKMLLRFSDFLLGIAAKNAGTLVIMSVSRERSNDPILRALKEKVDEVVRADK